MDTFTLFSTEHFWFIGGGFLAVFAFIIIAAFLPRYRFAQVSALIILIIKVSELSYRHFYFGEPIKGLLPTLIFALLMMFTKSPSLFQVTYYWSLGAIFAILTPDVKYSFPHPLTLSFYITHFYLIFAAIYGVIFFEFKPTFRGWVDSFVFLNVLAVIIFFINSNLGTNYLYVNRIPDFTSPLDHFGKWPYYIAVVEGIYLILTYEIKKRACCTCPLFILQFNYKQSFYFFQSFKSFNICSYFICYSLIESLI